MKITFNKTEKRFALNKIFALLCVLISFSCFSCRRFDNATEEREYKAEKLYKKQKTIKIAAAGPWAQKRDGLLNGILYARDIINENGGINGARVLIEVYDDNYNIENGQKIAYKISEDPEICAVIGHQSSSITVSNSLIYHFYGLLQISPKATSIQYTNQGLDKVFRNISNDHELGRAAADFCKTQNWNNMIIYQVNSEYGRDLSNGFELRCNQNDIYISARTHFEGYDNIQNYLEDVKKWNSVYNYDAIFLAGTMPQTAEICSILRDAGVEVPIISGDTMDYKSFFSIANNRKIEDIYVVSNYDEDSDKEDFTLFKNGFEQKYESNIDQSTALGYDALMVLAQAIEKADSVKPAKVAKVLKEGKDFDTILGPYHFAKDGNVLGMKIFVKKTENGKFVKVSK